MARFLNINPTYNPFTMDEMLKIPMLYDANFREAEKQYNDLQDKTALLRLYAKDNPEINAALDNYDKSMQSVANSIASGVWDSDMANQARLMRNLYRDNIIPIATAIQQYESFMPNYLKNINGTEIGEKPSVKWFMEHPGSVPEVIQGSSVQEGLAKLIGQYAVTRQNTTKSTPILGGQYFEVYSGNGYDPEEIAEYLNNPTNAKYSDINSLVNTYKQNLGYDKMTPEKQAQINAYINTAIQIGMLGNRKVDRIQNRGYRVGGTGGSSDDLIMPFQDGGHLYQDGANINKTKRSILPGDPFPNVTYIEDLTANPKQLAQWKTWMKKYMKDNGFKSMAEVKGYYNRLQTAKNTGVDYIKTPSERYQEALKDGIDETTLKAYFNGYIQPLQPNLRGGNFQSNVMNITRKGSSTSDRFSTKDKKTNRYELLGEYDSNSPNYIYSLRNHLGFRKEANNAQVSKMMFDDNGVLRTPAEFKRFLNTNKDYDKLTYANAHYDYKEFYDYLKSIGYNMNRSHKNVKTTGGKEITPYMAMRSFIKQNINSTEAPNLQGLTGYYNYNLGPKAAKRVYNKIAGGSDYELAGFEAEGDTVQPVRGGKFTDNFNDELNYSLQFYPVANTYILSIEGQTQNRGGRRHHVDKKIIIPLDKIDTQLSPVLNGVKPSKAFNKVYNNIKIAKQNYEKNPSIKNELIYGDALDDLTQLENKFAESVPRLLEILEEYNANTKENYEF